MELDGEQRAALRALVNRGDVPATIATRARIVLWRAEGKRRKDTAVLAGVSLPTVDRWLARYGDEGIAGLELCRMPRRASRSRSGSLIVGRHCG